jgi:hypothetical protein
MEGNPYEAPKTPAKPAPRTWPRFNGYEVAFFGVIAVLAVWSLLGVVSVKFAQWHAHSNVQTAPENPPGNATGENSD